MHSWAPDTAQLSKSGFSQPRGTAPDGIQLTAQTDNQSPGDPTQRGGSAVSDAP